VALDDLSELDRYRRFGSFPPGWEEDRDWGRVFFAPQDNLAGALYEMVRSAQDSLFIAMRSMENSELVQLVYGKNCYTQVTLGEGIGDYALSDGWAAGSPNLIQAAVIDGTDVVTGSADWSSGPGSGDLVVVRDPAWAAFYMASLSAMHSLALSKQTERETP
jgi:hypothetical protein